MTCDNLTNMFGDTYICARPDDHKGDHQQQAGDRMAQWSGSGGSLWWLVDERHPHWHIVECPVCGVLHKPEASTVTRGGDHCFHCVFWTQRMAHYINGELMVIEGTVYSWGAEHGYGGREFTITTEDGVTVTKRGLWCGGDVPWEYRAVMQDNATFGEFYRTPDTTQP